MRGFVKVTPRHDRFIQAIADSPIHIIATMRGKDQYETSKDDRGKVTVQKLGVGAKQRDGFEYEFTCTFLLDQKTNTAEVEKDNTHLFENAGPKILDENDGKRIYMWANSGEGYTPINRNSVPAQEASPASELDAIHSEIISLCNELGGTSNADLMALLKKYSKNGNPKAVKDVAIATEMLNEVKALRA